jgi:hypothetical protein
MDVRSSEPGEIGVDDERRRTHPLHRCADRAVQTWGFVEPDLDPGRSVQIGRRQRDDAKTHLIEDRNDMFEQRSHEVPALAGSEHMGESPLRERAHPDGNQGGGEHRSIR